MLASIQSASFVNAQAPDSLFMSTCDRGSASSVLDVGNVSAALNNSGLLFYPAKNGHGYEVPKGSGIGGMSYMSFNMAGYVGSSLRSSGTRINPSDVWPGPLDGLGIAPKDCAPYDKIWKVNASNDVTSLWNEDNPSAATLAWPGDIGAPFFDANGDGKYQPLDGDVPKVFGDEMHWWIQNDRGNEHKMFKSLPLGIERRVSAFAFDRAGVLENITFYRYEIKNRNRKRIEKAFVSVFLDVELGNFYDNYAGTDTTLGMVYFYNADNNDEMKRGYGQAPPALGMIMLETPKAQMDSSAGECDHSPENVPLYSTVNPGGGRYWDGAFDTPSLYHYMHGRWGDGSAVTYGGRGIQTGKPTRFFYPGDPVTGEYWSEINGDGNGNPLPPSWREMYANYGPFCLNPEETATFTFALIWSRGQSNLDSITKLRQDAAFVLGIRDIILTPVNEAPDPIPLEYQLEVGVYPNPSNENVTVFYELADRAKVEIDIFDMLGRKKHSEMRVHEEAGRTEIVLRTASWPSGAYYLRYRIGSLTESKMFVVAH